MPPTQLSQKGKIPKSGRKEGKVAEISFDEQRRRRQPAPRPARRKQKPKPKKDERTKFDKWLERMRDDRSPVVFSFLESPFGYVERDLDVTRCHVLDVDRYMLLLEFDSLEGEAWWVAKSLIKSAAPDSLPSVP